MRRGARIAAPLFPAAFALGASFGVLARTAHLGSLAAIVMSATTFAGSAQVASASVLAAGGSVAAAVVAALLLNVRYAPIGISVAQSFRGSVIKRFAQAQLVVDESWALAGGGTTRFDKRVLLGVGAMIWFAPSATRPRSGSTARSRHSSPRSSRPSCATAGVSRRRRAAR
jgi:predicted branched-subunit amino acid permease